MTGGLLAAPLVADAQQVGRIYRLGILSPGGRIASGGSADVTLTGLRELGYVEGQNLVVEPRYAEGKAGRLPELARELAQLRVDVIIAVSAVAVQAAMEATRTIPIVMGFASDPVGRGFIGSLARPGGNITGVTYWVGPEFEAKRLQLLKEAVPRAKKITVLATKEPQVASNLREAQKIAPALGVKLFVHEVGDADYDHALSKMVAEGAGALLIAVSPTLNRDQKLITGFAAKYRLPSICEWREDVEEGCLMAYGSSRSGLYRRVVSYVDRLFKGANPADLPIEQPSKFELVIDLKTAKALGLTIPQSLLQRADQVSE